MTNDFRVALVVPDYTYDWNDERQFGLSELTRACRAREIDLVVFPEGYECVPVPSAQETVDWWASTFGAPVLMGVESDGFQLAVYQNPDPKAGETATHVYVKHSTSPRLAFEWPGYQGPHDPMFAPIKLHEERFGVQICHDMFFGRVGQRLLATGSQMLIDLTAGNVNLAKWRNIVRARSLEMQGPFLCTMGYSPEASGASDGLAYQRGQELEPIKNTTKTNRVGGYVVLALKEPPPVTHEEDHDYQPYTDKFYTDITLSLGTGKLADIIVTVTADGVTVGGAHPSSGVNEWHGFTKEGIGRIGVLPLPLSRLLDGTTVHRLDAQHGAFDHHILLYHSPEPPSRVGDTIALMKLRAIEHRAGIALLAGDNREVLKTTRYKNIQRFQEIDGMFGLNAESLGGTESTFGGGSGLGIPYQWLEAYRSLLELPGINR